MALKEQNHGWAKQINELLQSWGLEADSPAIQAKRVLHWKREVKDAAEITNRQKIRDECEARNRGEKKQEPILATRC